MKLKNIRVKANKNDLDEVINSAIKVTKPSNTELRKLSKIEGNIRKEIAEYSSPNIVDVRTYGSFEKQTGVKNDTDIDIFILIDKNIDEVNFEKIALEVGFRSLKKFKPRTRYAEHPYVEGFVNLGGKGRDEVRINIVPCYDVEKGHWKSSADRSQYHTKYMTEKLSQNQKDEVRVLKKFLKTAGSYGAELSTSGFSGYVSEVLILKFGNFKRVIQNIASLKNDGAIISMDDNVIEEKNYKKFSSPIIIIDPIDPNRNLGAAISAESLSKFIMTARSFLRNPSMRFFKFDTTYIDKNLNNKFLKHKELLSKLVILEFCYSERSPDVIWGQLKKLERSISKQLDKAGFRVIRSNCYIEKKNTAKIVLLFDLIQIPEYVENIGPNIFMGSEV